MSKRPRGQEVQINLTIDSQIVGSILVKQFSNTYKNEIKEEGYLGETGNRYDSIYIGVSGSFAANFDDVSVFNFFDAVIDKNTRRLPNSRINIKRTVTFSDGQVGVTVFPDVEFGDIPVEFGSRTEYGQISIDFACTRAFHLVA